MKRQILLLTSAAILALGLFSQVYPVPDDGHLRPFIQPDSSVFMGQGFGDEFIHRYETEDGYTFVKGYTDHWYYYAQQNAEGDLVPTEWKVGTVDPESKGISPYLDFADPKKAELLAVRDSVNAQRTPEPLYENVSLGVILIEFPDKRHKSCKHNKPGYRMSAFENLFFSNETYVPPARSPHCDEENPQDQDQVFGSVNDFWQEVAYGQMSIIGDILNPDDGHPVWYEADSCMDYYNTGSGNLYLEAITAAEAAGFDPDSYDNLCILYAGDWNVQGYGNGLWPHAVGNHYFMSETQSYDAGEYFCHIGVHCHEIGHLLGLHDKYDYPGEPVYWDLMGYGWRLPKPSQEPYNRIHGACPAHINAISKLHLGWLEPSYVDSELPDQVLFPVETSNQAYIYPVDNGRYTKEFFVVEYRTTEGQGYKFDKYTYYASDPSTDGVLIWHAIWPYGAGHLYETVERADNDYDDPVGDLWPGNTGKDAFTPLSTPSTGGYPADTPVDSLWGSQPIATGFSTEGIIRDQSPLTIDASFYNNRWAGAIERPSVWEGDNLVVGDVVVKVFPYVVCDSPLVVCESIGPSGTMGCDTCAVDSCALVINPGSQIEFSPDASLIVDGALRALGTPTSMITFTKTPGSGRWGGIEFSSQSHDTAGILDYCYVQYANTGISCHSSSPTLSHNTVWANQYGITCSDGASPLIDSCRVSYNANTGILCQNVSAPIIQGCDIYENSEYGVQNTCASVVVDADSNWWGDASGPNDPSSGPPDYNPEGAGDKVTDWVAYRPWLEGPVVGVSEPSPEKSLPQEFTLSQNYPNPFNPSTQIKYALPRDCWVRLDVYNILGQKVTTLVDGEQKAGYKVSRWDASRLASGVYIYRIQAGDFAQSRKMILLK